MELKLAKTHGRLGKVLGSNCTFMELKLKIRFAVMR